MVNANGRPGDLSVHVEGESLKPVADYEDMDFITSMMNFEPNLLLRSCTRGQLHFIQQLIVT